MLLTFLSPTDAMLCSMAMQDAMHEHNLKTQSEDDRIHIRVAAHLGEVRVARNDIFGEPVNLCSRIEGIAPADEIYLSEAVYMAMNTAEVPAMEVGFRELKGVSQAIRIYSIPRFSRHRLIPETIEGADQNSELLYPYGGMQYRVKHSDRRLLQRFVRFSKKERNSRSMLVSLFFVIAALLLLKWQPFFTLGDIWPSNPAKTVSEVSVAALPKLESAKAASPTVTPSVVVPAARTAKVPATPRVTSLVKPAVKAPVVAKAKVPAKKVAKPVRKRKPVWSVTSAKAAYRNKTLSKPEYRVLIRQLKDEYNTTIRRLKSDYRAEKISRDQYNEGVARAKKKYKGG